MRVVVLPVCQLELHPHVLLKYDFKNDLSSDDDHRAAKSKNAHPPEHYLTPHCSPILPSGSINTVCEIIKNSIVLRNLFNIKQENEENIEEKIDFKGHCRFIAFGPESDISICALLIPHTSSLELNYINKPDPPLSRQISKISYSHSLSNTSDKEKTFIEHDTVHLWISLDDLCHKLIHIDRVLKQHGILSKLNQIEHWVQSYHENPNQTMAKTNIDIPLQSIKSRARTLVWDIMEMKNETLYPHPVHGRIPNFRNNPSCSTLLAQLEQFQQARVIHICPSLAQEHLRLFSLSQGKVVLTPAPSIDSAMCYKLDPTLLRVHDFPRAATKSGAAALGTIVSLTAVGNLHVDIFVVASVVVNPISGARLGKGKGYGDIEYAMMYQMGACDDKTLVITTVHESQLLNDLPASVMTEHDLPVNIIITPQRIIYTQNKFSRPHAINWDEIDNDTILNLPVLKEFKRLQKSCSKS